MQFIGSHLAIWTTSAGAVLDIIYKTKIIKDDRVSCVSRLLVEHEPGGVCGVWAEVKAL